MTQTANSLDEGGRSTDSPATAAAGSEPARTCRGKFAAAREAFLAEVAGNAEPVMVSMKIANRGDRALHDVRVTTDRSFGDFHSLDTIMRSAGIERPAPTLENLKKLMRFYVQSRSVGRSAIARAIYCNPVLQFNIANTGMCCYNNSVAALLAQALGFRGCGDASAFWHADHAVAGFMLDGQIRLLDIHTPGMLCYRKDRPAELATVEDALFADDRNPYARVGDAAGLAYDSQPVTQLMGILRKHGLQPVLVRPCDPLNAYAGTTMRMDLRPGESIEWPYRNVSNQGLTNTANRYYSLESDGGGKWWKAKSCDDNPQYEDVFEEPQMYGNGLVVYEPDLAGDSWRDGTLSRFRVESRGERGSGPNLYPSAVGQPADIIWEMAHPYVTVGGRLRGAFRRRTAQDWLKVYVTADIGSLKHCSWGELTWGEPVYEASVGESVVMDADLDAIVCKRLGPLCQRYWVKVVMQAGVRKEDVGIESLRCETDFLFDLHARPILGCGANRVTYQDATAPDVRRNVEVEFRYQPLAVPSVSRQHSRIDVPGAGNAVPADGMRFFWVRVALRDEAGRPIPHKQVRLTSDRGAADDIAWMPSPCRDFLPNGMQFAPLVLNQATYRFTNFKMKGQPAKMATPEHGVDDWNGYICFMVQSRTPGPATLTASTMDGQEIGAVTVCYG